MKEDDRAIGFVHIRWIEWNHGNAHFDIAIGSPEDRGKGYGSEALQMLLRYAFEELHLNKVEIRCATGNTRSCAGPERLGFTREGVIRQAEWLYDHYIDLVLYGMLAREWQAMKPI